MNVLRRRDSSSVLGPRRWMSGHWCGLQGSSGRGRQTRHSQTYPQNLWISLVVCVVLRPYPPHDLVILASKHLLHGPNYRSLIQVAADNRERLSLPPLGRGEGCADISFLSNNRSRQAQPVRGHIMRRRCCCDRAGGTICHATWNLRSLAWRKVCWILFVCGCGDGICSAVRSAGGFCRAITTSLA